MGVYMHARVDVLAARGILSHSLTLTRACLIVFQGFGIFCVDIGSAHPIFLSYILLILPPQDGASRRRGL